jgi:2-oxo-4-hydroxy-4-carboxy-5-ureidoimidazoline decarboxylase
VTIAELNALPADAARDALTRCCGCARWVEALLAERPFADRDGLLRAADGVWQGLGPDQWREAFAHHPRIGDVASLRQRFASTASWAAAEQAGAAGANEGVLAALAAGNRAYEARFGFLFIVCATGKRADEMLALLTARLHNPLDEELRIAAGEQAKITALRLGKLLDS